MKKQLINKLGLIVWLAFAGTFFLSCSDEVESTPTSIQLSTGTLTFNSLGLTSNGQTPSVTVLSNKYWTLKFNDETDWLQVSPMAGVNETEVLFTARKNPLDSERTATLVLESLDGTTTQLIVKQSSQSEMVYYMTENMGTEEVSGLDIVGYDRWQKDGIGALVTRYIGKQTKLDNENPSSAYEGASGGNNILFPESSTDAESEFTWGKIETRKQTHFQLSFGVMSTSDFNPSDFNLFISNDNLLWIPLPYTRGSNAGWDLATVKFKVFETPELYFKLVSTAGKVYRLDDIQLIEDESRSGKEIIFKGEEPEKPKEVLLDEDFEWLLPWATASNAGQTVENDDPSASAPQLPNAIADGISALDALLEKGYEFLRVRAPGKNESECIYLQRNYLKFGKTSYQAGIVLPKLENVPSDVPIILTFDWSPMRQGSGTIDPVNLIVVVANGDDEVTFDIPESGFEKGQALEWIKAEVDLTGVQITPDTKITIRQTQWPATTANRWFLDNIKIMTSDN